MSASSFVSLDLSTENKTKLEKLLDDLEKIPWEKGEYYFQNFVDYYQLPQIIRVEQTWNTDFVNNQWIYLQALFDRYLIIVSALTPSNTTTSTPEKYLLPDWFQGECRVLSKSPILKKRWWVFQGAFELYRFELPRTIKILSYTPGHIRRENNEWEKVLLSKNAHFNVIRRQQYQSRVKNSKNNLFVSEPKEAFLLQDPNTNDEFLMPPGVPLRFATLINPYELHQQYQNHDGIFTLPEIMMRYEFPIDIEILTHLPIDLLDFRPQVKLEKFCVAKSILAYFMVDDQTKTVELSPLSQFTIRCAKCLTYGLPQEGDQTTDEKFDEKEYKAYEEIRSQMNIIFNDRTEIHRSKIQVASKEEIECIENAYEISMKIKADEEKTVAKAYLTLEEGLKVIKDKMNDKMPFPEVQPKRFTVHASTDPSNPYNEIIDYENMDAHQSKTPSGQHPALVVQQLPPPMFLPPESFEKTIRAIPEKLYTDFLPATKSKKSAKTDQ